MPHLNKACQTVLVTSRGNTQIMGKEILRDNIIALDWHMPVSYTPLQYAISVDKSRLSNKLIKDSGSFALNFMPLSKKDEVLLCKTQSGDSVDKFERTKLTKIDGEKINCSLIKEASAILECEVSNEIDTGDHTIFIGKVLTKHENNDEDRIFNTGNSFSTIK